LDALRKTATVKIGLENTIGIPSPGSNSMSTQNACRGLVNDFTAPTKKEYHFFRTPYT